MNGRIGIAVGDVTGIGPEVTLKALAQSQPGDRDYVIFGDFTLLKDLNARLGLRLPLVRRGAGEDQTHGLAVVETLETPLPPHLPAGHELAALAAVAWLEEAARWCLRGQLKGMVTAPVNKEAIVRAGYKFIGQTEFLSNLAGATRTVMMLLGADDRGRWLRVALATTHVPISRVAQSLDAGKVQLAIELAARACHDLGLERQRVAVCGLNPHAGEGGKMGHEEQTIIRPAVEAARNSGLDVTGPLSADALFYYALRGDYDAVVAMYHDQGLAPLKMVCFENGVNWTLGLPFTRTSPDHGTAYDIAGKGVASPSSMVAALRLAQRLVGT